MPYNQKKKKYNVLTRKTNHILNTKSKNSDSNQSLKSVPRRKSYCIISAISDLNRNSVRT